MTIYDIAKLAGVSTATVSRVLNGGKSVSEETRQAVMHVIRQNDYQPSAIARGLSLKTMSMIGILAADAMLGEVTADMALAVGRSRAKKLLLPVNQCGNLVAGTQNLSLSRVMDEAVELLTALCQEA